MKTILLADDEENILLLTSILFEEQGYTIIKANNGEEALELAKKHHPDLIITDLLMPKMTGHEVCKAVRNTKEIEFTPIIILSAMGDDYNKLTGFEGGADDYITKPFDIDELKERANALLLRFLARKRETTPITPSEEQFIEDHTEKKVLPTGIPELDEKLGGGLPKGSNILVLGPIGHGKSSFGRQFIAEGLNQNEPCLTTILDEDPVRIRQSIQRYLKTPGSSLDEMKNFRLIDAYSWSSLSPSTAERFRIDGILDLNQLSNVISDASMEIGHSVQAKKGGRRVIDSITSLFVHFELPDVQRFLTQIARTATSFGGVTTLFVLEKGTVPEQTLNNIKYLMDGTIEFDIHNNQKAIRVAHLKWAQYQPDWVYAGDNKWMV